LALVANARTLKDNLSPSRLLNKSLIIYDTIQYTTQSESDDVKAMMSLGLLGLTDCVHDINLCTKYGVPSKNTVFHRQK